MDAKPLRRVAMKVLPVSAEYRKGFLSFVNQVWTEIGHGDSTRDIAHKNVYLKYASHIGCFCSTPVILGACYLLILAVSYITYGLYAVSKLIVVSSLYVPLVCVFTTISYLLVPIFRFLGHLTWYIFAEKLFGAEPIPSDAVLVVIGTMEIAILINRLLLAALFRARSKICRLRNKLERVKQPRLCVICLDVERLKEVVLKPCRHLCVCSTCAPELDACPICRRPVKRKEKLFDA